MLRAFIKFPDGRVVTDASRDSLTTALRDPQAVLWVDMEAPTDEEYSLLDDVFGFHPLAIEDAMQYSQRPKIESYNHIGDIHRQGYFFMVFHGPDLETFRNQLRTRELDMFVSERYLVTVHDDPMRTLSDLADRAASDARVVLDGGIDLLLHYIMDHIVDNYQAILDYLQEELDNVEDRALTDPTPDVLSEISVRKRDLLNLRRIVGPQREVIAMLTRGEVPFIRETTRIYFRDVQDHLIRVVELVELYRDLALGARDIYLSSISNHLNQIMKTLTIITVIAVPLTVISSFYGMNFEYIPGLHSAAGFWIAVAFMFGISTVMVAVFKKKGWI